MRSRCDRSSLCTKYCMYPLHSPSPTRPHPCRPACTVDGERGRVSGVGGSAATRHRELLLGPLTRGPGAARHWHPPLGPDRPTSSHPEPHPLAPSRRHLRLLPVAATHASSLSHPLPTPPAPSHSPSLTQTPNSRTHPASDPRPLLLQAASVMRWIARGGSHMNYYMW